MLKKRPKGGEKKGHFQAKNGADSDIHRKKAPFLNQKRFFEFHAPPTGFRIAVGRPGAGIFRQADQRVPESYGASLRLVHGVGKPKKSRFSFFVTLVTPAACKNL